MERKIVELLIEGKSARDIMRDLKLGDRRIRRIRCLALEYGYLGEPPLSPLPVYPEPLFPDGPDGRESKASDANSLILTRKPWIVERLEAGWHPITVFEEIGLPVGRSSFYRFLHRHGLFELVETVRRVVPEIVHQPGEALLLDWGKLRNVVDPVTGKKRTLWAFVGVLGYSRYLMVKLVWSNETKITLTTIEAMLREIGGVPTKVTSDNPKCFALEASRYEPLLNPAFERMAGHYGMRIECLPPRDPEKKGKVERPMPYVRRLYEGHGMEWKGLEESQAYMDRKLVIANERKHGTTRMKPIEQLLQIEVSHLKSLPALAYEPEEVSDAKVRRDGHARFDNKYYSLEEKFIGKDVLVLATSTQVSIYCEGRLAEIHPRIAADDIRSKSTKPHHLKPWEQEMQNGSMYRTKAQRLGPDVDRFVLALLNQGQGFIDTRKIWGILSLDKSHTPAQINEACKKALELDSLSYRMVKSLIKLMAGHPESIPSVGIAPSETAREYATNKFVRPMSVYEEQLKLLH
jgi:transposase